MQHRAKDFLRRLGGWVGLEEKGGREVREGGRDVREGRREGGKKGGRGERGGRGGGREGWQQIEFTTQSISWPYRTRIGWFPFVIFYTAAFR